VVTVPRSGIGRRSTIAGAIMHELPDEPASSVDVVDDATFDLLQRSTCSRR
jgi:hypothetical protein